MELRTVNHEELCKVKTKQQKNNRKKGTNNKSIISLFGEHFFSKYRFIQIINYECKKKVELRRLEIGKDNHKK